MNLIRKALSWLFGLEALSNTYSYVVVPALYYSTPHNSMDLLQSARLLAFYCVYLGITIVLAIAWWITQTSKKSSRGWALSASAINLLMWVPGLYFVPRIHWSDILPMTIILHVPVGIAGLLAFWPTAAGSMPFKPPGANLQLRGDGTIEWVNRNSGSLFIIGGLGSFYWWQYWFASKQIPVGNPEPLRTLLNILLAGIAADAILQIVNTLTGLALGMKIRSFAIGPLTWIYLSGRYEFKFKLARLLSIGGASSFLPARSECSRATAIWALAAGPIATLFAGVVSLWIAIASEHDSPMQAGGYLALFGAFCMVVPLVHLIPFRKNGSYSPGAAIIQILRGGPWAELHRISVEVLATLSGPTRPKDFDMDRIKRASSAVTSGHQALLLRLYSYLHFLDCGQDREASAALQDAEAVYHSSASDIPAELHADFIFGNAYVRRDANQARAWWDRMEAKKPARRSVDYWRAKAALHWIEGNRSEAVEAWSKSDAIAQRLPNAGIYEFDRYCCNLLRGALDETPGNFEPR